MSKRDKLIEKFKSDSEFTYQELEKLLKFLGYDVIEGEGSRVKFLNRNNNNIIKTHKPHPDKSVKDYVRREIMARLKDELL
jgi:predicted RNA binding protein YcfA (HicA-like mRNA interferase family)